MWAESWAREGRSDFGLGGDGKSAAVRGGGEASKWSKRSVVEKSGADQKRVTLNGAEPIVATRARLGMCARPPLRHHILARL